MNHVEVEQIHVTTVVDPYIYYYEFIEVVQFEETEFFNPLFEPLTASTDAFEEFIYDDCAVDTNVTSIEKLKLGYHNPFHQHLPTLIDSTEEDLVSYYLGEGYFDVNVVPLYLFVKEAQTKSKYSLFEALKASYRKSISSLFSSRANGTATPTSPTGNTHEAETDLAASMDVLGVGLDDTYEFNSYVRYEPLKDDTASSRPSSFNSSFDGSSDEEVSQTFAQKTPKSTMSYGAIGTDAACTSPNHLLERTYIPIKRHSLSPRRQSKRKQNEEEYLNFISSLPKPAHSKHSRSRSLSLSPSKELVTKSEEEIDSDEDLETYNELGVLPSFSNVSMSSHIEQHKSRKRFSLFSPKKPKTRLSADFMVSPSTKGLSSLLPFSSPLELPLYSSSSSFLIPSSTPSLSKAEVLKKKRQKYNKLMKRVLKDLNQKKNPFALLPPELIHAIFTFLELEDNLHLGQTCSLLRSISEEGSLWKVFCDQKTLNLDTQFVKKSFRRYFFENQFRVAVMGEKQSGKTSLIQYLTNNPEYLLLESGSQFSSHHRVELTGEEYYYLKFREVNEVSCMETLRTVLQNTAVILLCFSATDRASFAAAKKTIQRLRKALAKEKLTSTSAMVPIILVATKVDERYYAQQQESFSARSIVDSQEAAKLAQKANLWAYCEIAIPANFGSDSLVNCIMSAHLHRIRFLQSLLYLDAFDSRATEVPILVTEESSTSTSPPLSAEGSTLPSAYDQKQTSSSSSTTKSTIEEDMDEMLLI